MLRQLIFKIVFYGWRYEIGQDLLNDPKKVVIGFPHTSPLDGLRAISFAILMKQDHHVLAKQELFWFPLGYVLKRLGCIPVDRTQSKHIVQKMAEEFAESEKFTLLLSPEGTRKHLDEPHPIHTGFWHIAKEANVPIVLILSDNKNKIGRVFAKVIPSDSIDNDLLKIQALYAEYGIHVELP
jgi:1-acyl-sn-glycerol-3-phosphate acyltransferase